MPLDMTAAWAFAGVALPLYVRARRTSRRCRIPVAMLRAYHQSDAWRARKRAYHAHHPHVCVACLWSFPLAYIRWVLRLVFVWFPPIRRLVKRLFRRNSLQLHHVTYRRIWDGTMLHPGAEWSRDLMILCTSVPIISRVCGGCSHHAAADRVRRFCERTGLPPVALTRLWVLKCWAVQMTLMGGVLLVWAQNV